ncbi:hypothetical protein L0152_23810, partial [bacterium]|nr:hypothetical protein [bacterium]
MKKYIGIFIWIALASMAFAQNEEPEAAPTATTGPYLAHSLNWMIGNWEGEGKRGDTTFSSDLEVSP